MKINLEKICFTYKYFQAGPLISENAQDTLQQFCRWQEMYNDRNDDAPNHHDVAILLTRHDICRFNFIYFLFAHLF